jgi:hypothetical protein
MAKGTRAGRLTHRLEALDAIGADRARGYDKALKALKQLWQPGRQPQQIRLRAAFMEASPPATDPPPLSQLIASRGYALRVALLALFAAQIKKGAAAHHLELPLIATRSDEIAWTDLVVAPVAPGKGSAARSAHDKRTRSARAALTRIAQPDISLAELPRAHQPKGGYDEVRLYEDTGPRTFGHPVPYRIPNSGNDVLDIPVNFFLNGWIYVLEDTELVTYLMYRRLCSQASPAHISSDLRRERFGIKQSAWENYWLLVDSGLLLVEHDENRRPDGTFAEQSAGATPLRHRFTLRDEGLSNDGLRVVWGAVDRRMGRG